MRIELTSPAFQDGQPIPVAHTGDGQDASPPLGWGSLPDGTQSLALICDDPDAPGGTWVHWVLYGLPANADGLPENVPAAEHVPNGAKQGLNDFRRIGYGGPCPPRGPAHRYFFRLYALDTDIGLRPGATQADLRARMEGHILAEGELMGTYQRG
jgi:Raf kinase inhibitor-like YbhB/YbcL family protein